MTDDIRIGIIGGSGLYDMDALTDIEHRTLTTPFGDPSGPLVIGTISGKRVAFIARHGAGHRLNPSEVPYRANIYALKMLGVRFVISANACGSLREDYAPGHIVIPHQLVDFTKGYRANSFFENGLVAHIGVADPLCPHLSQILYDAVKSTDATTHLGGKFITIEGPRFSTKGESHLYRSWGLDIIGMTTCPEAFLALEAEMSFATMAHVTDYDVWHDEPVNVDMVIRTLTANVAHAKAAIVHAVEHLDLDADYPAHNALATAIITARNAIAPDARARLGPLVDKYL